MNFIAAIQLTRPKQWPILSAQFLLGVLLFFFLQEPQVPLGSFEGFISWTPLLVGWLVWVVFLNGATLAFNSAFDQDAGPVAYLRQPPPPPAHLEWIMLLVMGLGVILGLFFVGQAFAVTVGGCLVLSVLYSHRLTRWKSIPGLDLLVNVLGYGAGTTLAGLLVGSAMAPAHSIPESGLFFIAGFGLLFGSLYPLTQIYQVHEDRLRKDHTLAAAMGIKPALVTALGLGLGAAICLRAGIAHDLSRPSPLFLMGALGLWLVHLVWWLLRTEAMSDAQHEMGMYRALWLWALVDFSLLTEMLLR